jgi:hypothetical protein
VLAAAVAVVAVVVVVVLATTMAMCDFLFVSGTSPMTLDRTTLSGWCSTCRRWEVGLLPHPTHPQLERSLLPRSELPSASLPPPGHCSPPSPPDARDCIASSAAHPSWAALMCCVVLCCTAPSLLAFRGGGRGGGCGCGRGRGRGVRGGRKPPLTLG